jgi:hypothetical protein
MWVVCFAMLLLLLSHFLHASVCSGFQLLLLVLLLVH